MAEDLLDTIGQLFGPIRGGLAYAVVRVGAMLAATTAVVAASVISMGLISLPIMLRYGSTGAWPRRDRRLRTLAQIIPPSLGDIMADQLGQIVGDRYRRFHPRLHPGRAYLAYILGITLFKPQWAPALPPEARVFREPSGRDRAPPAADIAPSRRQPPMYYALTLCHEKPLDETTLSLRCRSASGHRLCRGRDQSRDEMTCSRAMAEKSPSS